MWQTKIIGNIKVSNANRQVNSIFLQKNEKKHGLTEKCSRFSTKIAQKKNSPISYVWVQLLRIFRSVIILQRIEIESSFAQITHNSILVSYFFSASFGSCYCSWFVIPVSTRVIAHAKIEQLIFYLGIPLNGGHFVIILMDFQSSKN